MTTLTRTSPPIRVSLAGSLLTLAALVYILAWLLPSLIMDVFGPIVLNGWGATRAALSPIWPGDAAGSGLYETLTVASGLTNLLFLAALFTAARWPQRVTAGWERAVWLAALLNTQWFVFGVGNRGNLRIGYYMWVGSFVLLAAALHQLRRRGPAA